MGVRGLDWSNERYARLYTRDSVPWLVLPWQARALYPQILRLADANGEILCDDLEPHEAIGALLRDWPGDVVAVGVGALIEKRWLSNRSDPSVLAIEDYFAMESSQRPVTREELVKAKPKYVYLMMNFKTGLLKIGFSKHPEERVKQVAWQVKSAGEVKVLASSLSHQYRRVERLYHQIFEQERQGGEWFDLDSDQTNFVITTLNDVDSRIDDLTAALDERSHIKVVVEAKRQELHTQGLMA